MSTMTLTQTPRVLLVEANELLAQHIGNDLRESGYEICIAQDAESGLAQAQAFQPSLIVIDRLLAGESGAWLCSHLRSQGNRTPVLLMMARDALEDRIACLEAGADDYFLKPYQTEKFLKLVHLYLQPIETEVEQLQFGDMTLNLANRTVYRNGRTIDLTVKEFELLRYLMEHPREVMTREQILENVWGYDFMGESNVIEVYIRYLRLKIEDEGDKRLIQTVRGVGYVLRES